MEGYHIGEVCRLLDVKPHVLRYWEQEIPFLSPRKDDSGRRLYSIRDVNMLFRLRHLLYDRKYTVEGARQRIWEELEGISPDIQARIHAIRHELLSALSLIHDPKKAGSDTFPTEFCRK